MGQGRPLLFAGSGSQSFPDLDHSGRTRWVRTGGNCFTFTLLNEDHMLGNALQYMVMKNPDVEFCGYCITHPSESKINFQIQTREEHEGVQGTEGGRDI
ncbi:DNA-directed RNA polymerases I and III subunit RPAC2-like [Melopsittacus undulatus]|uniref:DNA-directed RNA polymerases I and III subunit RPAC2-like n=1 Tax=Melopsittacus undulatus TaxID=13146 RepID=UPI00146E451D|nr:DNA-directed RNA polymerases I and III subunit RPAC2-like [Melopsittacus undulatus]